MFLPGKRRPTPPLASRDPDWRNWKGPTAEDPWLPSPPLTAEELEQEKIVRPIPSKPVAEPFNYDRYTSKVRLLWKVARTIAAEKVAEARRQAQLSKNSEAFQPNGLSHLSPSPQSVQPSLGAENSGAFFEPEGPSQPPLPPPLPPLPPPLPLPPLPPSSPPQSAQPPQPAQPPLEASQQPPYPMQPGEQAPQLPYPMQPPLEPSQQPQYPMQPPLEASQQPPYPTQPGDEVPQLPYPMQPPLEPSQQP
jgi:hypothetical protein